MPIAVSNARAIWGSATEEEWNDWKWQLRHSIKRREQLSQVVELTPDEVGNSPAGDCC